MRFRDWPGLLSCLFLIAEDGRAAPAAPAPQIAPAKHAQRASSRRVTARRGCADRLAFEVDPADLRDPPVGAAEAERARGAIEEAFKRVASALCVAGTLPVTSFLMFDRVMLRHAEGAMEPTIYPGERPRTLVYELFDVYRRPVDEALLRAGLLCLASPGREGCYQD